MVTKDIARLIYNCYQEIENGKGMIEELKGRLNEKGELKLKEEWGREVRGLELRIPSDGTSWQIRHVPLKIAIDVIQDHIKNQEIELERLKDVVKVQMS